jgi:hypothetical protein
MNPNPPRYPVVCEINGHTYRGTCWIARQGVIVVTSLGEICRPLGNIPPHLQAKQLLAELALQGKAPAMPPAKPLRPADGYAMRTAQVFGREKTSGQVKASLH